MLLTILPVFWPNLPPIGLGFLQSYLSGHGFPADILDLNNLFYNSVDDTLKKEWMISCNISLEQNILNILKDNYPDLLQSVINKLIKYNTIGFSCFKSNFICTLEMIKILKAQKRDIKILLGGPEITRQYFKINGILTDQVEPIADLIVVGEGEKPLLNYVAGKAKDKLSVFQEMEKIESPYFPRYHGIKLNDYPKKDSIAIQFSRGCIKKCNFCSERLLYKGFRTRDISDIIEEIRFHKEQNQIKYFIFFDSMLNADLVKLNNLCNAIISNFGCINWEAQMAVRSDMNKSLLDKVKESGCYNLFIGLESGSDTTLKRMNKGYTTTQAVDFFKKLNKAGISFGISMIVGYPGETDAEFEQTLDFIRDNKAIIPKIEQINPFTYYDGTNTDPKEDYKCNPLSIKRMNRIIEEIKKNKYKYTKAFLGNLIEK